MIESYKLMSGKEQLDFRQFFRLAEIVIRCGFNQSINQSINHLLPAPYVGPNSKLCCIESETPGVWVDGPFSETKVRTDETDMSLETPSKL